MKKKILALCLVVVLAVTAVTGATLAYFTDNDKASNTFELGGVDITLTEKAYKDGAWTEIEDPDGTAELGQLDPIANDWDKITEAGYAYNKGVFTINNEDEAYIRNYIAVESLANGEGKDNVYDIWYNNVDVKNPSESPDGVRHGAVLTETFENVEINGTLYDIYVFDTIEGVAVPTDDSFMTLTTVILNDWVTNDEVEELGPQFEVYTFSEAIQSTGLTHAEAMTALIGEDGTLEAHATSLISSLING